MDCRSTGIAWETAVGPTPTAAAMPGQTRIAIGMLQRAIEAGVPFPGFTADEDFGQVKRGRFYPRDRLGPGR